MDQKTIDKVLRCRAIIDRHRDWLKGKFDQFEADVATETAKLESKDKGDVRKSGAASPYRAWSGKTTLYFMRRSNRRAICQ